jgi:hypothetical protein
VSQALTNSSIVGLLSIVVALLPLAAGVAYAARPTEPRLALMRPLSLAGIFAGLCGLLTGVLSMLKGIGVRTDPIQVNLLAIGAAESLVPLFIAFASLTAAWLCVALGMRRHS